MGKTYEEFPELLTIEEAMEFIGVNRGQVKAWIDRPAHVRLPFVWVGKSKRVVKSAVRPWLEGEAGRS